MSKEGQLQDLAHIRGLMDRSSRFLGLSGLSGVVAGLVALGGALLAHYHITRTAGPGMDPLTYGAQGRGPVDGLVLQLLVDALCVLALALLGAWWFTWRRGKRTGQGLWDLSARRLLINLMVPLSTGGLLCLALFHYGLPGLAVPCTMLFYGIALFNAARYTLDEVRWLGICELVLGMIALFRPEAGLLFWALGFGVLHIIYGVAMYLRHERGAEEAGA